MTKVNFIHVCETAFFTVNSNNLNIIGIFTAINSQAFPVIQPKICFAVGLEGQPGDHDLEITLSDEIAEILKASHKIKIGDNGFGNWVHNSVALQIPREGVYTVAIKKAGELLGSTTISVKKI